jgi:hypothetical protein
MKMRVAMIAVVSVVVWTAIARAQPEGIAAAEEAPSWMAAPMLSDPTFYEQLWRPGDLVDDTHWLRRPWSAGLLFGTMDGDELGDGVDQSSDWFYGLRVGNDFAPRWGWEFRSAFFSPDLVYAGQPGRQGIAHDWFLDMSVVHYPWGDTRIRPFWSVGLGAMQVKFDSETTRDVSEWMLDAPIAIGCKYFARPWLALRCEGGDTICLGAENIDVGQNWFFSVGAEVHWHSFKTRPVAYGY